MFDIQRSAMENIFKKVSKILETTAVDDDSNDKQSDGKKKGNLIELLRSRRKLRRKSKSKSQKREKRFISKKGKKGYGKKGGSYGHCG